MLLFRNIVLCSREATGVKAPAPKKAVLAMPARPLVTGLLDMPPLLLNSRVRVVFV